MMMQEIEARRATEADLEVIRDILTTNDLPVADLEENLDAFYLFESGMNTVGVGAVQPADGDGLLRSVVILETHRGRGYGTWCCERLLELADEQGMARVYLLTTGAADFFSKLGFSKVDRAEVPPAIRVTRQFSDLCPESATCMQLSL